MPEPPERRSALGATRFLIADHEEIVRAGLVALLKEKGLVEAVPEPVTKQSVLGMANRFGPDVIILEDEMPDTDMLDIVARLRSRCPGAVVIVLASSAPAQRVLDAIGAGASAFLLRAAPEEQLVTAIDRAVTGGAYVDPEVAGEIILELSRSTAASEGPATLTPRELEVLGEIARGRSNREIGYDLQVAASTVKVHVERILRKLGAANRVEATTLGLQSGLIAAEALDVHPAIDRAEA